MLAATDPRSKQRYSMSYIYDSFSWPHCQSGKYNINRLLASLAAYNKNKQASEAVH